MEPTADLEKEEEVTGGPGLKSWASSNATGGERERERERVVTIEIKCRMQAQEIYKNVVESKKKESF